MANISTSEITKLRQMTGAGIMDCKEALKEAEGDFEKAREVIREKGKAVASKRADNEASEGAVLATASGDSKKGALIVLNCETDFVAKNEDFLNLAQSILQKAVEDLPQDLQALKETKLQEKTVNEEIENITGIIGEKIELSYYDKIEAEKVASYIHPGNKVASIVGLNKANCDDQVAKDLAMQVAAMNPLGIDQNDIPQKEVDKEMDLIKQQIKQEGKPDHLVDKIAQGKIKKFYEENALLNQQFIKDNKKSVSDYLQEHDPELTVTAMKQYSIAG